MACAQEVEAAILHHLHGNGSAPMEHLFRQLTEFTFNQVFCAVDRLSREGRIRLTRVTNSDYLLSPVRGDTHRRSSTEERIDHEATRETQRAPNTGPRVEVSAGRHAGKRGRAREAVGPR